MKLIATVLAALATVPAAVAFPAVAFAADTSAPVFVKKIPPSYRYWRLVSIAREAGGLDDIRAVLVNDVAIKAYRATQLPFPGGTIIARILGGVDHLKLRDEAIAVPSSATDAIGETCRQAGVVASIGVNERDGGSLYNTQRLFDADGALSSGAARSEVW